MSHIALLAIAAVAGAAGLHVWVKRRLRRSALRAQAPADARPFWSEAFRIEPEAFEPAGRESLARRRARLAAKELGGPEA